MTPPGSDVINVLTEDHREVEEMFVRIEALAAGNPERKRLADRVLAQLMAEVREHVAEEENDYFPMLAAHAPAKDLETLGRAVTAVKKVVPPGRTPAPRTARR